MDPRLEAAIAALYDAATGVRAWRHAMQAVAETLPAWSAHLCGIDRSTGTIVFSHEGGSAGPAFWHAYLREHRRADPRTAPILALGPDDWFDDHDALGAAAIAAHPFYRDFLAPHGGGRTRAARIDDDASIAVVLCVTRAAGEPPYDGPVLDALERIRTHLRHAQRLRTRLRRRGGPLQRVGAALLDRFDRPMLLLDATRGIWCANAGARAALDRGDLATVRDGTLLLVDRASDEALSLALHALRLDGDDGGAPDRRVVRARAADGTSVALHLLAMRPDPDVGVFGVRVAALVAIHDPRRVGAPDAGAVADTFDFTPAEARVAIGLASGRTVEDIAREHRLSVHTVRAQLRSAMQKMHVTRQAELVRRLGAMPSSPD